MDAASNLSAGSGGRDVLRALAASRQFALCPRALFDRYSIEAVAIVVHLAKDVLSIDLQRLNDNAERE
jgi:hypothetical protein